MTMLMNPRSATCAAAYRVPPIAYILILRTVCDRWQHIRYDGLCRNLSFAVIQKLNEWGRVLWRLPVVMFTFWRKRYERAGFCKNADAAHPNQTFEEGHVCILRGVTRATLIFLLDLLKLLQLESE